MFTLATRAMHSRSTFLLASVTILLIAMACRQASVAPEEKERGENAALPAAVALAQGFAEPGASADALATRERADDRLPSSAQSQTTMPSMIIRRGDISVRVDSLDLAIAAVRRLAAALGGFVGDVSMNAGDYEVRRATLVMRIPSARFDEALAGVGPLGKVEHSSVSAEDVGEEFVDVTARIANGRRLESRLVDLLATRTGKLEEVLSVERELARVRGEIERYEGRARFLSARVATSTIAVTVSERAPVVGTTPGRSVLAEAFVNAWRNFVGLVARVIESLGVLVPVLLLLWAGVRIVRARRRAPMASL